MLVLVVHFSIIDTRRLTHGNVVLQKGGQENLRVIDLQFISVPNPLPNFALSFPWIWSCKARAFLW